MSNIKNNINSNNLKSSKSAQSVGAANAKRKASSSPKQMCDLIKKIKSEKGTTTTANTNPSAKKTTINPSNIKTSTPAESPAKPTTSQQPSTNLNKKTSSNQPNLKLLVCRVCNNNYDSKHLPVLISDCMETCCDYCAQKFLTISNSNKFKCGLCGKEHRVPESKVFQPNKFVVDFLNIKIPKLADRTNQYNAITNTNSASKVNYKEVEVKLEKLANAFNEFTEDYEDKLCKSKLKLAEYCEYFLNSIKDKHQLYLKDFNSEYAKMQAKFNELTQKLLNDLNTFKQSSNKKDTDLKELTNKIASLESYFHTQTDLVKQAISLKSEQEHFVNYMIDNLGARLPRSIELSFENENLVDKKSIHAISSNKVFYCTMDKKNEKLIACVREIKVNNSILEKFELEPNSKLKYVTNDQNNLLAYFDLVNECKIIKYDTKFNKPKCLSSNREIVYMSSTELMLFSNKTNTKQIKVLDQELNSIESFGQSVNEKQGFYFRNRQFKIVGVSLHKLVLKYEMDKYLRIFARACGSLVSEIKLNDSNFDENDLNNVKIKFIDENEFHILMISKQKMKLKVLNNSGVCLREFNLSVRSNFDRFSITNDDLIAFYYENDNLIQFIQL